MHRKIIKLLYRTGLLKRYPVVDNLRYLKRVRSGKDAHEGDYFSEKDSAQYRNNKEVVVRVFLGPSHCYLSANPETHIGAGLLRDPVRALTLPRLVATFLNKGVFVDVGANIGLFSLPIASAFPGVQVKAFEPNPAAIRRLKSNISLNRHIANIEVLPVGIGESEGEFTLYSFEEQDIGQSSLLRPANFTEKPTEVQIAVRTLDSMLGSSDSVEVLKVDVQGLELEVLRGATRIVERDKPVILLEHEDSNFPAQGEATDRKQQLRAFFAAHEYQVFYISKKDSNLLFSVDWDAPLDGDLLALPRAKTEDVR